MQAAASKRSARARATVVLPAPGIPTIKITSGAGDTTRRLARRRGAADRAPSPVKTVRPSSYCEVMFDPRGLRVAATLSPVSTRAPGGDRARVPVGRAGGALGQPQPFGRPKQD